MDDATGLNVKLQYVIPSHPIKSNACAVNSSIVGNWYYRNK